MNKVICLCGKPGSGKSSLSKQLFQDFNIAEYSADTFMLEKYGEIQDLSEFEQKLNECKDIMYSLSKKQLNAGMNIVFDFGFWTKQERTYVTKIFSDFEVVFVYLKLPENELFKRIEKRNQERPDHTYFFDKPTFDLLCSKFEEPDESENVVIFENYEDMCKKLNLHKEH